MQRPRTGDNGATLGRGRGHDFSLADHYCPDCMSAPQIARPQIRSKERRCREEALARAAAMRAKVVATVDNERDRSPVFEDCFARLGKNSRATAGAGVGPANHEPAPFAEAAWLQDVWESEKSGLRFDARLRDMQQEAGAAVRLVDAACFAEHAAITRSHDLRDLLRLSSTLLPGSMRRYPSRTLPVVARVIAWLCFGERRPAPHVSLRVWELWFARLGTPPAPPRNFRVTRRIAPDSGAPRRPSFTCCRRLLGAMGKRRMQPGPCSKQTGTAPRAGEQTDRSIVVHSVALHVGGETAMQPPCLSPFLRLSPALGEVGGLVALWRVASHIVAAPRVIRSQGRSSAEGEPGQMAVVAEVGGAGISEAAGADDPSLDDFRAAAWRRAGDGRIRVERCEVVRELLRSGFEVEKLLVQPGLLEELRPALEARARSGLRRPCATVCDAELLEEVSGIRLQDRGELALALAWRPPSCSLDALIAQVPEVLDTGCGRRVVRRVGKGPGRGRCGAPLETFDVRRSVW